MSLQKQTLRRRTFLKGLGATVGTLTLGGAFRGPVIAQPPPVVTVGTILDYTGPLAEYGLAMRKGADLAVKHLNDAAQGLLGGPILKLVHEDSAHPNFALAVERATKLVRIDGAVGLIGGLASSMSLALARGVSVPNKVPQISPSSTSPLLTAEKDDDYLFRVIVSDAAQGVVLAMLARGEIKEVPVKYNTASTLYVNNAYGQGLSNQFTKSFVKRGGKVLAEVGYPEEPQASYLGELRKALEGKPDVLVLPGYTGEAQVYLKEAVEVLKYKSFLFTDGTKSVDLIKAVGADTLEGFYGTVGAPDPADPSPKLFAAEYQRAFGSPLPPLPYIDTTYDATVVLCLAAAKAIFDKVAKVTGTEVRDRLRFIANPPGANVIVGAVSLALAFASLRTGADINYEGAGGSQDFDANGDVVTPIMVWQYNKATPGGIKDYVALVTKVPSE